MSIACDFCFRLAERHEDVKFIESPSRRAHICEDCIQVCVEELAMRKAE